MQEHACMSSLSASQTGLAYFEHNNKRPGGLHRAATIRSSYSENKAGSDLFGTRSARPEGLAGALCRNAEYGRHHGACRRCGIEGVARSADVRIIQNVEDLAEQRQPVPFLEREGFG